MSADLFQSSSVLAYSCNPQSLPIQHPQSLPILTHLEASKHPIIPDCRNPLFDHLKGATAGPSRGPQGSTGVHSRSDLGPPPLPLGPHIDAPACTGIPNSSFEHPVGPSGIHMPPKASQAATKMSPRAPKWSPR